MSVTVRDPRRLPRWRKPRAWGGEGRDPVFAMWDVQLPGTLALREDSERPHSLHAFVEPSAKTSFDAYQMGLHGTQSLWELWHE